VALIIFVMPQHCYTKTNHPRLLHRHDQIKRGIHKDHAEKITWPYYFKTMQRIEF